jgi:hypothetical protein
VALLDAALADYPLPARAALAAGSSRTIPRGAELDLPGGDTLRLFLHWTEREGIRTDLDLSVLLFDAAWAPIGRCDYTNLRHPLGAVHSGDLTSAPAPLGATEYIDLDLPALQAGLVAHVAPVVFAYNDVPFGRLPEAFAGFAMPEAGGAQFDPARVALRFDLTADSRIVVPMTVDVLARRLRWVELHLTAHGYGHAAGRYAAAVGHAGEDMELAFGGGRRPTLLDLAALHAAARAGEVWLRGRDGGATRVEPDFDSIRDLGPVVPGGPLPELAGRAALVVAADRLPEPAAAAGPGSVLVAATSGDPLASADPLDLLADL